MKLHFQFITTLLFLCCFVYTSSVLAQQDVIKDYTLLQSQAPIPTSILTTSSTKTQKDIDQYKQKNDKIKEDKKTFLMESNYFIDNILTSPRLLFNTPLNKMIDDIAAKLLADDPKLLEDVTFYVIKTSAVNAFATDRGDIFITMGLIARAKTEAELAFIIAHELIHYREKHSMEAFEKREEIQKNNRKRGGSSIDLFVKKNHYSHKREKEADKEGFKLFAKAGYSLGKAEEAFIILEMSHTQIYNTPITKEFFERGHIHIHEEKWLDEATRLAAPNEEEDKFSTHPKMSERKDQLDEERTYYSINNRADYITTTTEQFQQLTVMAQMEMVEILIIEQQYAAAAYHCFALLQQYPDNIFLQEKLAYALYGASQYALAEEEDDEDIDIGLGFGHKEDKEAEKKHKELLEQGEWNKVNQLFKKLTPKELASMAGVYCWEQHLAHPEDEQLERIAQDLLEDIVIYNVEDPLHYYAKAPLDTAIVNSTKSFARFSFADYMHDKNFTKHLEKGIEYRAKRQKRKEEEENKSLVSIKKEKRKKKMKGKAVGAKKTVLINPIYIEGDITIKSTCSPISQIDYKKFDHNQQVLYDNIDMASDLTDLTVETLDIRRLKNQDAIEKLINIHEIDNWMDQFFSHPFYMVATNHNITQGIAKEYETTYFTSMGAGSITILWPIRHYLGGLSMLIYSYIPPQFSLYHAFTKKQNTFFYCNTIDINQYSLVLDDEHTIDIRNKDAVIANLVYGAFYQLKAERSKKNK